MAIAQLPASALYAPPSLARLWKEVHLNYSPFYQRPALRRLYTQPATVLRALLRHAPYNFIALGCAEGLKESLLLRKLPKPTLLLTADTCLSMAKIAARKLPAYAKIARQIDLTSPSSISRILTPPSPRSKSKAPSPARLITLFGVLPNLDPLPLLRRLARAMKRGDLLLFSTNLAPGNSSFSGARKVLPQYDNPITRRWVEAAVQRYRPKLPQGTLHIGIHPDPQQSSLPRIEARWISRKSTRIVFASRRPTRSQVEQWIQVARLHKIARFIDTLGEEGVWLASC